MHLLFLDESGTAPGPTDKAPDYFVIGGVIIPDAAWHRTRDALAGLKIRHRLRGELKWRYFAPKNDDARNPMRGRSHMERDLIRTDLYRLMRKEPLLTTVACVTSRRAAYAMRSVQSRDDLYHLTYKALTERFQYYLQDASKAGGSRESGIVIADHRASGDDDRLQRHHEKLLHSTGGHISRYENLIEGLFLQDSRLSVGIQLADLVSGAVWRKFERGDAKFYAQLEQTLRKNRAGRRGLRDCQDAEDNLGLNRGTPGETLVSTCSLTHSRRT